MKRPVAAQEESELSEYEDSQPTEDEEPSQCFGPGCVEPALQGSKYCSDECGLKLATKLVTFFLALTWRGI